jgi:Cu2+-exporting ATPase
MAETLDLSMFVEPGDAGASRMTLAVDGIACAGCIREIESGLTRLTGVIDARVNFTQRRLSVDWHNDEIDAAGIIKASAIAPILLRRSVPTPTRAPKPLGC